MYFHSTFFSYERLRRDNERKSAGSAKGILAENRTKNVCFSSWLLFIVFGQVYQRQHRRSKESEVLVSESHSAAKEPKKSAYEHQQSPSFSQWSELCAEWSADPVVNLETLVGWKIRKDSKKKRMREAEGETSSSRIFWMVNVFRPFLADVAMVTNKLMKSPILLVNFYWTHPQTFLEPKQSIRQKD